MSSTEHRNELQFKNSQQIYYKAWLESNTWKDVALENYYYLLKMKIDLVMLYTNIDIKISNFNYFVLYGIKLRHSYWSLNALVAQ